MSVTPVQSPTSGEPSIITVHGTPINCVPVGKVVGGDEVVVGAEVVVGGGGGRRR